jgi:uncharacterized RDD family membrane protein YckC
MAIRPYALPIRSAALLVLAAAAPANAPPADGSQPTDSLRAAGGDDAAWAFYQSTDVPAEQRAWRFAYRTPEVDKQIGWLQPTHWGPVKGRIGQAAVRGKRLHIIFEDGTHRLYTPQDASMALKLPRPVVPLAMAGDDKADALYAVVAKHIAEALETKGEPFGFAEEREPPPFPEEPVTTETGTAEPEGPADDDRETDRMERIEPVDLWPASKYVLLRYGSGRWHLDRGLPEWVGEGSSVRLTCSDAAVEILVSTKDAGAPLWYAESPAIDQPWTNRSAIDGVAADQILDVVRTDKGMTIVRRRSDNSVSLMHRTGDAWSEGQRLTVGGTAWKLPSGGAAFASYTGHLLGVWLDENEMPQWAQWDAQGGAPAAGPHPLRALVAERGFQAVKTQYSLITYIALGVIIATVMIRRRGILITPVDVKPPYRLASHRTRLAAFAVDWIVFGPALVFAFYPPLEAHEFSTSRLLEAASLDPTVAAGLLRRWMAAVWAFGFYTAIFEIWLGATPGKRLLKCRVLTESSEPGGAGRMLVRNLCRVLEMYPYMAFVWTVMLVLLTRNRQRLGDLLGGTIVVERQPAEQ